eukprot:TRINITY_DN15344_c0_g1_i1.p1 TRINITY_DN15344_c0_g1~~TRINITY_DN15344_c0_g1_i1.p1  ORF type:complete len:461 (-),score=72.97 TRINITY_DN15344_c0_g1_i1:63-1403(-)
MAALATSEGWSERQFHDGSKMSHFNWVLTLHHRSVHREGGNEGDGQGLLNILGSPAYVLLLCFPVGLVSVFEWNNDVLTFWMMFCAMIPLVKILGDATEELALNLHNQMLSGLLNAIFGNAAVIIITVSFMLLQRFDVVKMFLMGSVLSDLLLVLGMAFLAGGFVKPKRPDTNHLTDVLQDQDLNSELTSKEKQQKFSSEGALMNSSILIVACLLFILITLLDKLVGGDSSKYDMLPVSRVCSILLAMTYVAFLVFQLVTHAETMVGEMEKNDNPETAKEQSVLSLPCSIALFIITTAMLCAASHFLAGSFETAVESSGLTSIFVSIFLLPIIGNACEHDSTIRFAVEERVGLSVGIAVGSAVQVALFHIPFSVLLGWALGASSAGKNMDLNFGMFNVLVLSLSVIVVLSTVVDGKSNWLEGYMLLTAYLILYVLYWSLPEGYGTF